MPPTETTAFRRVRKYAGRAIGRFRMIDDGDRILVGLSGGVDSMILMQALIDLRRRAPIDFSIVAVTVDMGFPTFDAAALERYCAGAAWPFERVEFPGYDLLREKDAGDRPCSFCSRLRRGQLHAAADRLGCNKLALGQQLDDLCVSLLISLFRGNGIKTMGANVAADSGTKRLIRPLCLVPKSLIVEAAMPFGFPSVKSCPYEAALTRDGDRAYVERLLRQIEPQFHNIREAMLHSMGEIQLAHLLDPAHMDFGPDMPG